MTDYSKTVIYKVFSKNSNQYYIGSTTNFLQRKYEHKSRSDAGLVDMNLYREVQKTGGWENGKWKMEILETYPCKNEKQVLKREEIWYKRLSPSLNTQHPNNKIK